MGTWLIKSEPGAYAFSQLVNDKHTSWTGVRNYTARNNLRAMKKGDLALFYHSNIGKAVVGIAKVIREAYAETTSDNDEWSAVDFAPVRTLPTPVTLDVMRGHPSLSEMVLFKQSRLSVSPVTKAEFDAIVAIGSVPPPADSVPAPKKTAKKATASSTKSPKKLAKTATESAGKKR
jgi:predicted RNA-binding protein with PUA-like domain